MSEADRPPRFASLVAKPLRVIVVSAATPGAGCTSLAAHLAVGLLSIGLRAAIVDLDVQRRALSRWFAARTRRAERGETSLVMPAAPRTSPLIERDLARAEAEEAARWPDVLAALSKVADTVIVDAPAGASELSALAHASADLTLSLAPESPMDLSALFDVDASGVETGRPGPYGRMIWEARTTRAQRARSDVDWMLVRARGLADWGADGYALEDRYVTVQRLFGARAGPTVSENPAWRAGMASGLTALDAPYAETANGRRAVEELRDLIIAAKLPGLAGASLAF